MGKLAPEELWRRHTLERFEAFRQSGELEKLQKEGLAACGRKKRFTSLEWAKSPMRERYSSPRYMEWHHKCENVAQKFGLAVWTVVSACLISGYEPHKAGLVVESEWPRIRVITESTDSQFLARLAYEAQLRGLRVIARQGSVLRYPMLLLIRSVSQVSNLNRKGHRQPPSNSDSIAAYSSSTAVSPTRFLGESYYLVYHTS